MTGRSMYFLCKSRDFLSVSVAEVVVLILPAL